MELDDLRFILIGAAMAAFDEAQVLVSSRSRRISEFVTADINR